MNDMAGKKVNVGPPGSGGQINSFYILDALDLRDKVRAQNLTFDGGARALADRQIDVTTGSGIPVTVPAITEISQTNDVTYIPLTEDDFAKIAAKYPFYFPVTAPAGIVKGVDSPVDVIMYSAYWVVNDKTPDDVVKAMLEIVTEPANKKALTDIHVNWSEVNGDFSGVSKLGIPIHKAAAGFWTSQGVALPEGMPVQ
jgi:TRAP transporter TAXI family solute receptor